MPTELLIVFLAFEKILTMSFKGTYYVHFPLSIFISGTALKHLCVIHNEMKVLMYVNRLFCSLWLKHIVIALAPLKAHVVLIGQTSEVQEWTTSAETKITAAHMY